MRLKLFLRIFICWKRSFGLKILVLYQAYENNRFSYEGVISIWQESLLYTSPPPL